MKTIYIKTTDTCNLDCPHCYTSGSLGKKVFWDTDKVINWIKQLDTYFPSSESFHLELHGGEPFISNIEDLIKVAKFAKSLTRETTLGITTNLVFNLSEKRLQFILDYIDGISTSWDIKGRFQNEQQYSLWEKNIHLLQQNNFYPDLNISLSKPLTLYPLDKLYQEVILKNKFDRIRFEKITYSGNAIINRDIIPTNKEANDYLLKLHEFFKDKKEEIVNLEEIYIKFSKGISNSGTYFRQCESNLYTINADGTIGGCPNDAPTLHYSNLDIPFRQHQSSNKRLIQIVNESTLKDDCYDCQYIQYCGGGCYKLQWDETGCPSPKKLFSLLLKDKQK